MSKIDRTPYIPTAYINTSDVVAQFQFLERMLNAGIIDEENFIITDKGNNQAEFINTIQDNILEGNNLFDITPVQWKMRT